MKIEFISSINRIASKQWNALWGDDYPFTQHEFLASLENSGCTTADTGWQPHHCVVWRDELLIAAVPLYIKAHSYGEYVFDWSWANAYHEHGMQYYPKLVNAIPFTPSCGPRWGIHEQIRAPEVTEEVYQQIQLAIITEAAQCECSGIHILFPQAHLLQHPAMQHNWLPRYDCQYHWVNNSYANFAAFLDDLTSRKRKSIRKEREKVCLQNIRLEMVSGNDLTQADWLKFHHLYQLTYDKRSGHQGYLNTAFFCALGQSMTKNLVMAKAFFENQWVAAALFFFDSTTLYGRYWGSLAEFDSLHFECCYYQGIEFAIDEKLRRFDSGAQGEHKIARGFQPVITASLHHIFDQRFAAAIESFVNDEKRHVIQQCQRLRQHLPIKDGVECIPAFHLIQ